MNRKTCLAAMQHFKQHDPIMERLLAHGIANPKTFKLPTKKPDSVYFSNIVSSIISQQISTKAADAIRSRVLGLLGSITPEQIILTPEEDLRSCGLSPQKIKYLYFNAKHWHTVPFSQFTTMDTKSVIAELIKLYGVGEWTAEMFCIFTLARTDVFSTGDLALRQSLCHYYHVKPHYTKIIATTISAWSPYQSMAALALWHARDTGLAL
jgi:DNA-3-methyladenine glycosylase II